MIDANSSSSSPKLPPPPPLQPPQSMTTSASNTTSITTTTTSTAPPAADSSGKKVRKPYTITKSRESWTEEEHDKFLEALLLFDRDWKKIEDFVGSKTVIQIRSHAQKYFLKAQKNGTVAHVPPPRPKRKATHPYPQKASKNVLLPLPASMAYPSSIPEYASWDDASMLINTATSKIMPSQDEFSNLHGAEALLMPYKITDSADIASKEVSRISNNNIIGLGTLSRAVPSFEMPKQGKQASVVHGLPDFAEVCSFIGSVFDPDAKGHVQKLKEMDPINFETVLLLMRNLTVNFSSPDFESIEKEMHYLMQWQFCCQQDCNDRFSLMKLKVLSSYDVDTKTVGVIDKKHSKDISC